MWKVKNYINLLIIVFLLAWFCYYFTKFENFDNQEKQKIWAMSFGGGSKNYHEAAFRLRNELSTSNAFHEIVIFTDNELKKDDTFWKEHGDFIEKNNRGYGYWIWKPYLIKKTMEKMNDNDILIYLDSGCEVINDTNTNQNILNIVDKCDAYHMLYTSTGHNERIHTKTDLLEYMKMNNEDIKNSIQNQATMVILIKNTKTIDFVNEWYNVSCNYHLIDDSSSVLPNDPLFIDHRHDQSIFSLLTKHNKYNFNTENNVIEPYPFLLSRKRDGFL